MLKRLASIFRPTTASAPCTRALDAAGGGSRWAADPGMASFTADVAASGPTVRRRSAHYHRNNPWAARATATLVANLVGAGVRPQSEAPAGLLELIDGAWSRWATSADASGRADFYGLQMLALRSIVETGESFSLLRVSDAGNLAVQLLDVRQVDEALQRELGDGRRIIAGVEIDELGLALAYHILPTAPGDPWGRATQPVRIEASSVVHVFEQLAAGQLRGLPWLTSVLLRLSDLDAFEDAELVRQKIAAMFAGFLTETDTTDPIFSGDKVGDKLMAEIQPGTLKILPAGKDIKFAEPAQTDGNYLPFVQQQLRAIAAGIGVTYEQLTGDMTNVSYSSARVALIEFRRRAEQLQQQLVVGQFSAPIWRRWLDLEVLAGRLPPEALGSTVRWVPPAWDWIDPLKDCEAEQLAVANGFKSRGDVVRERGRDPDVVLAEIARDREAAAAAGLQFAAVLPTAAKGEPE